jgi:hypothetical protein
MFQDYKGNRFRKRCKLRATLNKRGRKRGLFGFLRGRPWATRVFELTSTYVSSTLKYFKDDVCKGQFDLIGCTVQSVPPSSADGRQHAFEIRLSSRERFVMAAENQTDQAKWIAALEQAGIVPTANDKLAHGMGIEVLGEDRELIAYQFLAAKGQREELKKNNKASEYDNATILALEEQLERDFTKICMGDKETRAEEELARQEFEREVETHLAEANAAKRAFAPEAAVDAKYNEKVAESRSRYVLAKEARFTAYIMSLVEKYR